MCQEFHSIETYVFIHQVFLFFIMQGTMIDNSINKLYKFVYGRKHTWILWVFCIFVCVLSHVQFFTMLWTVACQVPLSMGVFRQEYWSGLLFPPPGDLPKPGIKPTSPISPAVQVDSLPTEPSEKPILYFICIIVSCYMYYVSVEKKCTQIAKFWILR